VGGAESEEVNTKNNGIGAQPRRVNKRDPRLYHNATRKISTNASNNNHRTVMVRPSKALRRAKKLHRELQLPEAAGAEAAAEPSEDEAIEAEPEFPVPALQAPPPQVLQGTARSLLSPPPPQGPGLLARVLGGAAAAGASLFNPNAYLQNPGSSSSSSSYSQPAIGKSRKMYKKRNSVTRKLKK